MKKIGLLLLIGLFFCGESLADGQHYVGRYRGTVYVEYNECAQPVPNIQPVDFRVKRAGDGSYFLPWPAGYIGKGVPSDGALVMGADYGGVDSISPISVHVDFTIKRVRRSGVTFVYYGISTRPSGVCSTRSTGKLRRVVRR